MVGLTLSVYLILSVFVISHAETYEWTVINGVGEEVETNSSEVGENEEVTRSGEENGESEETNANVENKGAAKTDELNLDCESAILIEQNSGQVLYEKNAHEQLRPASVTKLMTILLTFEALEAGQITLEDKVPCSQNAASMGGSQIWLDPREELSVNEMLKAMCVVSANDYDVQFRHE